MGCGSGNSGEYCGKFCSVSDGCSIAGSYTMANGSDDNYGVSGNNNNGNVCGSTASSSR